MLQPVKKTRKHLFTSKKMSIRALMSDCLGAIAVVFTCVTVYLAYANGGSATAGGGAAFFLCLILAFAGEIIAIISRREADVYYFFCYLGMALNGAVIVFGVLVLYWGLYG